MLVLCMRSLRAVLSRKEEFFKSRIILAVFKVDSTGLPASRAAWTYSRSTYLLPWLTASRTNYPLAGLFYCRDLLISVFSFRLLVCSCSRFWRSIKLFFTCC